MAGSRTSTRAPAGHSSVREGATRTTSLGSRVAYLSRPMQQLCRRPCGRHKSATQQIYTQNCRGVKTDDRLTMLFDGLERRGAFAAFVQETWRVGEERTSSRAAASSASGQRSSRVVAASAWASCSDGSRTPRGATPVPWSTAISAVTE